MVRARCASWKERPASASVPPEPGAVTSDSAVARLAALCWRISPPIAPDSLKSGRRRASDWPKSTLKARPKPSVTSPTVAPVPTAPASPTLMAANDNIAVLRTLSKAHALAAARIGTLIADERLISVLRNCQAPYPLPAPCVELAIAALTPYACAVTRERVAMTVHERERVRLALGECDSVLRVYPSQGNYLLVRFSDPESAFTRLLAAGVVVRDMRASPQLADALRISIGTPEENDLLLSALRPARAAA